MVVGPVQVNHMVSITARQVEACQRIGLSPMKHQEGVMVIYTRDS